MKIQVSYARKINHELYGGNSFENSDWHASLELDMEECSKEDWEALQEQVKEAVDTAVDREIMYFQSGLPVQTFKTWLYDYVAGRKVEGAKYEEMSPYQKDLVQVIKRGKATFKRDQEKHDSES